MANKKKKTGLKVKMLISIFLFGVFLTAIFVSRAHAEKYFLSDLEVADVEIGGMGYDEAMILLDGEFEKILNKKLVVDFQSDSYEISVRDLGLQFDTYGTIERAYELSYGSTFFDHLQSRYRGWKDGISIDPLYDFDQSVMEQSLLALIPDIKDPVEARVFVNDEGLVEVESHLDGLRADFDSFSNELLEGVPDLNVPDSLELLAEELEVKYTEDNALEDASILEAILTQEVMFFANGDLYFEKSTNVLPEWVSIRQGEISFDQMEIESYVEREIVSELNKESSDLTIVALPDEGSNYVQTEGVVRDGVQVDVGKTVEDFVNNFNDNTLSTEVVIDILEGKVVNETDQELGKMVLLGRGRSNFEGSPEGRDFNIRKGLNEKFNNILLAPAETFSYNSFLGPVTYSAGWKASLAIFGGRDLVPVPGGGLCQVSTTAYRAIVNSGLDLVQKSNHSLYVHYYKKYGDGLDAAIFPGVKDLQFVNDTPGYLLIQAYDDGDDGYVELYGTPDGRDVELLGPFYSNNVPDELKGTISPAWNQIIWIQRITRSDGSVEENKLVSTYRTAPR